MPLQQLNLGASPNDGTGTPLRDGGRIINLNFELVSREFVELRAPDRSTPALVSLRLDPPAIDGETVHLTDEAGNSALFEFSTGRSAALELLFAGALAEGDELTFDDGRLAPLVFGPDPGQVPLGATLGDALDAIVQVLANHPGSQLRGQRTGAAGLIVRHVVPGVDGNFARVRWAFATATLAAPPAAGSSLGGWVNLAGGTDPAATRPGAVTVPLDPEFEDEFGGAFALAAAINATFALQVTAGAGLGAVRILGARDAICSRGAAAVTRTGGTTGRLAAGARLTTRLPFDLQLTGVQAVIRAPQAGLTRLVPRNGAGQPLFAAPVTIADGTAQSGASPAPAIATLAAGELVTVDVEAAGSGEGLVLRLLGRVL